MTLGSNLTVVKRFPILKKAPSADAMREPKTITAILGVGMLLLSPFAWGCERTDMRDCTMADCSMMADMQDDEGCHEPTESQGHESAGCSHGPEFGTSCCDAPIGQQPALIDFVAAGDGDGRDVQGRCGSRR